MNSFKRLTHSDIRWVGGLCAGLAYIIGLPTWVIRLIMVILLFQVNSVLLIYILLWIFVPSSEDYPKDYDERCE